MREKIVQMRTNLNPMEILNLKRHEEISSDPVQHEEDSVPVAGIKGNVRMHLMFIGKHFSLESHSHFAFVDHSF